MGARKLSYKTLYCIRSYNESSNGGNSYTTQFRQYDPRLGRWKSLDPLAGKFPNMSPFVAFINNPIIYIDKEGTDTLYFHTQMVESTSGKVLIFKVTFSVVINGVESFVEPDLPDGATELWFVVPYWAWQLPGNVWYPMGESVEFPIRYSFYGTVNKDEYPNSIRMKHVSEVSGSFRIMLHAMDKSSWSAGCVMPTTSVTKIDSQGEVVGVHVQESLDALRVLYDEYIISEDGLDISGRYTVQPINGYEFLMKTQSTSRFEITKMKPREVPTSIKSNLPKGELSGTKRTPYVSPTRKELRKRTRKTMKTKRKENRAKKKQKTSTPSI